MTLEQTAWAAIGLLAIFVIGMIPVFLMELRAIGARIDRLDEKMERGFERIDQRFEWNNHRFDRLEAKLDDHTQRHAG